MPTIAQRTDAQKEKRAALSRRLEQAATLHPHCPAMHEGRLGWLQKQMKQKGVSVSQQSLSQYFQGGLVPRPAKMDALAEVLGVDAAWLSFGSDVSNLPQGRLLRAEEVQGAVSVVAGIIALDGAHPSFPDQDDARAQREHIDLYAVIRGGHYSIHVAYGVRDKGSLTFSAPMTIGENVIIIGIIRDGLLFSLYEVTPEVIAESGQRRSGSITVTADEDKFLPITGFTHRL